jgi:hypothetical protein
MDTAMLTVSALLSGSAKPYVISTNLVPARCAPRTLETTGAAWV